MLERHMTETPHRNQNESRLVDHASFLFSCSNSHFQCIVAMLRGAVWVIDVSGCNLEVQSFLCVIHLLSASNVRMKLLTDFACALDVTYWLHTARVAKLFKDFGIMGSWLPGLAQKPAGVPVVLGLVTCQHENWLCQFVVLKIQFLQNVCAFFFAIQKRYSELHEPRLYFAHWGFGSLLPFLVVTPCVPWLLWCSGQTNIIPAAL